MPMDSLGQVDHLSALRKPQGRKPQVSGPAQNEALLHLWEAGLGPYTGAGKRGGADRMCHSKSVRLHHIFHYNSLLHSEYRKNGFLLIVILTLLLRPVLGKRLRTSKHSIREGSSKPLPSLFLWLSTHQAMRTIGHSSREGAFSF